MTTISTIHAREVLDSRGHPTVEAEVSLSDGSAGNAMVPSGASTGTYEAVERRDNDPSRFNGRGVLNAVAAVNDELAPTLAGKSALDQSAIDETMIALDGTPNKSRLGANAILAVSMAVAKAASASQSLSLYQHLAQGEAPTLPVPLFNILNGGRHARNSTDIQEFMVAPAGVDSFTEALRAGAEIYHALGRLLIRLDQSTTVGDEGGFAPSLASNREALDMVVQAISDAGYHPGENCFVALDVAASELITDGEYELVREGTRASSSGLIELYDEWATHYPVISIEDGLDEEDWDGWQALNQRIGGRVQLVGDDLLVTNVERIQRAIEAGAANALLVKPNQVGTLTETLRAVNTVKAAGWGTVMSHRSGETEDTTVADLSVAWSNGQIKAGAPCRSDRVAKYNRLLRIAEELGPRASYAGPSVYTRFKGGANSPRQRLD